MTPASRRTRGWWLAVGWLCLAGYLVGLALVRRAVQQPWDSLVVFPPEPLGRHGLLATLGQGMALLGAGGLIGVLPGLPVALVFAPPRWGRVATLLAGILLNAVLIVAVTAGLKAAGCVPLTRTAFVAGWGGCLFVGTGLVLLRRRAFETALARARPTPHEWRVLSWAGALVLVVGLVGYPKLVIENFNGDGLEVFAPAESLRTHQLPSWDLEIEPRFGLPIVEPYWSYDYLMFPWLLLLGPSEAAVRLPLLGALPLLWLAMVGLIRRRGDPVPSQGLLGFLAAGTLFALTAFLYYGGHDPFVADAALGTTYVILATLTLLQLYCLAHRHGGLFVGLALLAIGTKYWAGILSVAMLAAAWWRMPDARTWVGRLLGRLTALVGVAALGAVAVAWRGGYLGLWLPKLVEEFGHIHRWPWDHPWGLIQHVRQWAILAGVIPLISLGFIPRLSPGGQLLALTTIVYSGWLATVMPELTFHSQALLGLFTMVAGGCWLQQMPRRRRRPVEAAATALLAALTILVLPAARPVNTANRELGRQTCMRFSRYEDAMAHSRLADLLTARGLLGGHIDYPAWVHYAEVTDHPDRPYRYSLTTRSGPLEPGAVVVAESPTGTVLLAATPEDAQALRRWSPPLRPRNAWLRDLG